MSETIQKLDPVIKERILRTLRSGNYKYASGVLCEHGDEPGQYEYCSLGAIYHSVGVSNESLLQKRSNIFKDMLPIEVRECLAPFTVDGYRGGGSYGGDLHPGSAVMNRNDNSLSRSYKEAIEWIEKNL
jgi:hypothetical protein